MVVGEIDALPGALSQRPFTFYKTQYSPVGSLMYRWCSFRCCRGCRCCCCNSLISDWSVNLSIRLISHWRCDSSLMAAYSCTKACGFSDVWSSANSLVHCSCGTLMLTSSLISTSPMTPSWNRKPMILAGFTLSTTVLCSRLNLSFNTSFDSTQFNVV